MGTNETSHGFIMPTAMSLHARVRAFMLGPDRLPGLGVLSDTVKPVLLEVRAARTMCEAAFAYSATGSLLMLGSRMEKEISTLSNVDPYLEAC